MLGVNLYGIPGFIKDTWFNIDQPGTIKGQCSQICGKEHGYMPITVVAKTEADFKTWIDEQKKALAAAADDPSKQWTLDELRSKGAQVYAANCQACHQGTGMGVAGAFPALNGSKVVLGPAVEQIRIVLNGRPGTAMQGFGKPLSDTDIAAVITYTRNAWNNKTGEAIQPADVKAGRS